ncbi:hypothetical protein [Serratia proteamaculans]|uniref:hypothetical protein n=1 Tax=Serratia proteamaculans TaxID=28151 RepID=UPI0021795888|nr:hypothetical protein [Serratia proteamaculans]CAI1974605.1 Uncharacterised protein [Serratia proteamaculans]
MAIKLTRKFNAAQYIPELGITISADDVLIEVVHTIDGVNLQGNNATATYSTTVKGVKAIFPSEFNFIYQDGDPVSAAQNAMLASAEFSGAEII